MKSKIATGIEIILLQGVGFEINLVTLKRNKEDIVTELKSVAVTDIASLAMLVDTNSPIILVIDGKGVIHRKVAVSENDSLASILNKVLPNANLDEFYIQKQELNDSQNYISVTRALLVNDILNELKLCKITNIASCSIGPFVVNNVLTLIDTKSISNEFLNIGHHKLLIRENKIHEVHTSEDSGLSMIKVGDELMDSKLVVPFAAALSYFVGQESGVLNSGMLDKQKEDFRQKQKFQLFGWSLLVATFLILIVNYFVFNHYWEKCNVMNSKLVLNQSALKKYESLKEEYSQKKIFLEENGLLENSRTSYFADQVAASLPSSIVLLEMDIHPVKKKDQSDVSKAFYFDNKTIKISGKCNRNTELNDWMKSLRAKQWIASVNLLNYKQDNAKDDGVFFIELIIK